jgi:hypothetical protein
MGRGLGTLQRAILESLVPSKRLHAVGALNYRGGKSVTDISIHGDAPGVVQHGRRIALPDGIFDVRAVKALLLTVYGVSSRQNLNTHQTTPAFDVAFSRAIRTLSRRGVLARESYAGHRERRFVTCPGGAPQDVTLPEIHQAVASAEAKLKAPMPFVL